MFGDLWVLEEPWYVISHWASCIRHPFPRHRLLLPIRWCTRIRLAPTLPWRTIRHTSGSTFPEWLRTRRCSFSTFIKAVVVVVVVVRRQQHFAMEPFTRPSKRPTKAKKEKAPRTYHHVKVSKYEYWCGGISKNNTNSSVHRIGSNKILFWKQFFRPPPSSSITYSRGEG